MALTSETDPHKSSSRSSGEPIRTLTIHTHLREGN
jgi:hypothetical protein